MCEVGKRHAAELKHQSCYRLCATQVAGLGDFVEQPVQFVDGQCLFLPDIYSGEYVTKQSGDETGRTRFDTAVVDTAQHTHISRYGVRFQSAVIKILPVPSQTIAVDLSECDFGSITKLGK